ncbi:hypothetical protein PUNSTDRAFT_51278 [Punctularia strigosozonata HHB-11173 SS5]|uniref:uncharacterized protein n=1 Tax=Punctularia strigosozonata (strain HHB-11173) TaxID=741275 RepID=UPI00044163D4|nr:uncharacterized protein PUNSTDRAFT_51278 [Punctularia strigosozonata HHB-11173 SS5]EIN10672.1 hypothetical protein PUNSTDRAFT_51278 [Punctularia strigosozonata HHB-11173 SS5]
MATAQASSNRASLLSGLRTGGVRSATNPMAVPHTAAPTGSFNIPRFASATHGPGLPHFPEEDDELADLAQQSLNMHQAGHGRYPGHQVPMTAAVDGSFHQQQGVPAGNPFSPAAFGNNSNMQAQMQMQMMQMEIMRLQALQAQQYQAKLLAQAQRQQQQQNQGARRATAPFNPPATAGPMTTSFDMRSAAMNSQMHRANHADALRAQLGVGVPSDDQVPMTAALGGRFGSRAPTGRTSPEDNGPSRVISGGTSLGGSAVAPSKSDAAVSWRRNNNSVLSANRSASPSVKITPPPGERVSPPPGLKESVPKGRPQPLTFNAAAARPVAVVDDGAEDTSSAGSSPRSATSSPITPNSASPPLSPREEAAKKLYEGLGIGRPVPQGAIAVQQPQPVVQRVASMPVRQPLGPPSGELGAQNFATRVRKQAVSGLGALLAARERREAEAF